MATPNIHSIQPYHDPRYESAASTDALLRTVLKLLRATGHGVERDCHDESDERWVCIRPVPQALTDEGEAEWTLIFENDRHLCRWAVSEVAFPVAMHVCKIGNLGDDLTLPDEFLRAIGSGCRRRITDAAFRMAASMPDLRLSFADLADWIAANPGTRPSLWWKYDAPRLDASALGRWSRTVMAPRLIELRRKPSGEGQPLHEVLNYVPAHDYGIPAWCGNPADPPTFEPQRTYLKRHGLLLPADRRPITESVPHPLRIEPSARWKWTPC